MAHLDSPRSASVAKPYVVEASAVTKASLHKASRAITDPANLPRWFEGASGVEGTHGYPAVGGVLRWTVRWGGSSWDFGGKVIENELPGRLVVRVATRRSRGVTEHIFTEEGAGTRYTKRVTSEGSWWELLGARMFMGRSVRREVKAAARLADEAL
jgi:uncharacterized protein YndB with AHSA1/START domain